MIIFLRFLLLFISLRLRGGFVTIPKCNRVKGQRLFNKSDKSGNGDIRGRFHSSDLKSSAGHFVKRARDVSQDSKAMDKLEREEFLKLLEYHAPKMDAPALASISLSVAKMQSSLNLRTSTEKKILLDIIPNTYDYLEINDMASIFVALARLGVDWDRLNVDDRLIRRLVLLLPQVDDKSLGDIVWGIGSMGAKWDNLPDRCSFHIETALENHASKLSSYHLPSVLWALAKMGAKWPRLSRTMRSGLVNRLDTVAITLSPQQSSKLLWALGTLGCDFDDIGDKTIQSIIQNVSKIKRSQMGLAVPASQALTGLAKMGVTWQRVSPAIRANIYEQFIRVCQSANCGGIANGIWAMGTMGSPFEPQPKAVKDAMLSSVLRVTDTCSAWELCNMLWGMGKMQLDWAGLPDPIKSAIMSATQRVSEDMNPVDIGVMLWTLGSMDAPLDTLPVSFKGALLDALHRLMPIMKGQELSKAIWGLSETGVRWDAISNDLQWNINIALRRVADQMTPQAAANSAYAFANIAFDSVAPEDAAFRGIHEVLIDSTRRASQRLYSQEARALALAKWQRQRDREEDDMLLQKDEYFFDLGTGTRRIVEEMEQLRIFCQYVRITKAVADLSRIPEELLEKPLYIAEINGSSTQLYSRAAPLQLTSQLQSKVLKGLTEALAAYVNDISSLESASESDIRAATSLAIESERSSFEGVFPVDIAVTCNEVVVAIIEVDGPQHYRSNGCLRRKDLLKQTMYMRKHPESVFHRVRWDDSTSTLRLVSIPAKVSIARSISPSKSPSAADAICKDIIIQAAAAAGNVIQDANPLQQTAKSIYSAISDFFSWGLRNSKDYSS